MITIREVTKQCLSFCSFRLGYMFYLKVASCQLNYYTKNTLTMTIISGIPLHCTVCEVFIQSFKKWFIIRTDTPKCKELIQETLPSLLYVVFLYNSMVDLSISALPFIIFKIKMKYGRII